MNVKKKEPKKIHVIDEGKAEMDRCFTKMMNGEKVSPIWSEEDELHLKDAIHAAYSPECGGDELIDWLKSLKERIEHQWKPSEEQIEALEHFVKSIGESGFAYPHNYNIKCIYSLLNDLKKL